MASEQIETPVDTTTDSAPVPVPAPAPAEAETAVVAPEQAATAKESRPRRQRKAPEELFDLTQPIPRVSFTLHVKHFEITNLGLKC